MMSLPEDLFPIIPRDLYQKRVYRLQLRGSNGFSPFSLLKRRERHKNQLKNNVCQANIKSKKRAAIIKMLNTTKW